MNGGGKVNFKEDGRVIELPAGLTTLVGGERVLREREVRRRETVRVENSDGETVWRLSAAPDEHTPRQGRSRTSSETKTRRP